MGMTWRLVLVMKHSCHARDVGQGQSGLLQRDAMPCSERDDNVTRHAGQHFMGGRRQHGAVHDCEQVAVRTLGQPPVVVEQGLMDAAATRAWRCAMKLAKRVQRLGLGQIALRLECNDICTGAVVGGQVDGRGLRPEVGARFAAVFRTHDEKAERAVRTVGHAIRRQRLREPPADRRQVGGQWQFE